MLAFASPAAAAMNCATSQHRPGLPSARSCHNDLNLHVQRRIGQFQHDEAIAPDTAFSEPAGQGRDPYRSLRPRRRSHRNPVA